MPDQPDPALLAAILSEPDTEAPWLGLAGWYADHGRADEAVAVRVLWRTLSDSLHVQRPPDAVLDDLRRNASILGATAREIEERAYDR
jgi:uncharacterized protein (TIGR02996 family)